MLVRIIAVGRVRERFIRDGIEEYTKRLSRFFRVELVETKEEPCPEEFSPAHKERVLQREGEALLKALAPGPVVALDVHGRLLSSEELADYVAQLQLRGESTVQFVIGGSLGLAPAVLSRADLRLSFGRITLPHQLCRLVLFEQVYRVATILHGLPYHK